MLQLRRSLSMQSNPSTLTAGLFPKLALTQPPFLADDDVGDDRPEGGGIGASDGNGVSFSSPNRAS